MDKPAKKQTLATWRTSGGQVSIFACGNGYAESWLEKVAKKQTMPFGGSPGSHSERQAHTMAPSLAIW